MAERRRKRGLTLSQIIRLKRSECWTARSWLHLSHTGELLITNKDSHTVGGNSVRLTRAEFEKFVRFYEKALQCAGRG